MLPEVVEKQLVAGEIRRIVATSRNLEPLTVVIYKLRSFGTVMTKTEVINNDYRCTFNITVTEENLYSMVNVLKTSSLEFSVENKPVIKT